jgi:hypothetical protein
VIQSALWNGRWFEGEGELANYSGPFARPEARSRPPQFEFIPAVDALAWPHVVTHRHGSPGYGTSPHVACERLFKLTQAAAVCRRKVEHGTRLAQQGAAEQGGLSAHPTLERPEGAGVSVAAPGLRQCCLTLF